MGPEEQALQALLDQINCLKHASAYRNLEPEEQALQADEQALLNQICKAYYLPQWCSINDYERLMEAKGLQDIRTADWSEEVAPFWGAVIRSALSVEGFKGLFTAGLKTIKVTPSSRVSVKASCRTAAVWCMEAVHVWAEDNNSRSGCWAFM